jgi:4'-phosphopantetheinyl transferase
MSHVIVLHAPLSGHARATALLAALPYAKRLQLERRDAVAQGASLAGIVLALDAATSLRGKSVTAAELSFPEDGKPRLAAGPFFSIAHSVRTVVCAASLELDCGVDVEDVPAPGELVQASRDRLRTWTATEAVLKAAGLGVRAVKDVTVAADCATAQLRGVAYWLRELDLGPDSVACIATPQPIGSIRIVAGLPGRAAPDP